MMSVAEDLSNEPEREVLTGAWPTRFCISMMSIRALPVCTLCPMSTLMCGRGKTHAIIGPNGAGKSTLLNVCVGRLKPDRGAVVFDGTVLTGKQPHEINQLGVARVFQTPEVFPDLTVLENVMVPALSKRDGHFRLNPF